MSTFLTISILVSGYIFFIAGDLYESDARLMVRIGRENVADPTATIGESRAGSLPNQEVLRTEIEILKSREIAEEAVDAIGLENITRQIAEDPAVKEAYGKQLWKKISNVFVIPMKWAAGLMGHSEDPEEVKRQKIRDSAILGIMANLEVSPVRYSSIIEVSYQSKSPKLAHVMLDKIISVYLVKHINIHFTDSSYDFFNRQTSDLRTELEKTENELSQLKNKTGIAAVDDQRNILLQRIENSKQELKNTESALAASRARMRVLKDMIVNLPKMVRQQEIVGFTGAGADEVHRRVYELKMKEQELLSTFTEESVPVQEIRRQIRAAEALLRQEEDSPNIPQIPGDIKNRLQMELMTEEGNMSSLQAKASVLMQQIPEAQQELHTMISSETVLRRLERDMQMQESSYQKYSESLEQTRIDRALKLEKISNVSVAQPATRPIKPMDSKKRIILIAGILGGLAAAIGVAFLNENLDHRINRPDDVKRRLDLPSLVSVPLFGPGAGLLPDVTAIKNLVTIPERKLNVSRKAFASQDISREIRKYFEILMHRIVFAHKKEDEMPHIFAFTSCRHREGVSTVAANFAVNVARIGRGRVLMVDMNLLKFDANAAEDGPFPNLGNMIAVRRGNPSDSLPSPVDKLYMMEYSRQGKATELEELQSMWRKDYEYVIMDLPPVFDDARVMTLARLADEVILVVEAERERCEVIRTARDMLFEAKANLIGIILNKRIFYIPGWLYKTL